MFLGTVLYMYINKTQTNNDLYLSIYFNNIIYMYVYRVSKYDKNIYLKTYVANLYAYYFCVRKQAKLS